MNSSVPFENTKKLFFSYPPEAFLLLIVFEHLHILGGSTKLFFISVSKTNMTLYVVFFSILGTVNLKLCTYIQNTPLKMIYSPSPYCAVSPLNVWEPHTMECKSILFVMNRLPHL